MELTHAFPYTLNHLCITYDVSTVYISVLCHLGYCVFLPMQLYLLSILDLLTVENTDVEFTES